MRLRRLLAVLLAVLAAAGYAAVRPAHADVRSDLGLKPDANAAIAINTTDGSSLFEFAFAVRHVMGDVVDQQNAAVAYASCKSCQTTAIAIEIVLVEGSPHTFTPTNVAVAMNENCSLCDTFATAYQFVVQSSGPVHFTHEGLRELRAIRKEIASWGKRGLTNAEMRARLPALMDRVQQILKTQLVPDRKGDQQQGNEGGNQTDTTPVAQTPTDTTSTETGGAVTTGPTDTTTTTAPTTTGTTTTAPTTTTGTTTTTP
jgi:putative peptide zinc metalloprotease protein